MNCARASRPATTRTTGDAPCQALMAAGHPAGAHHRGGVRMAQSVLARSRRPKVRRLADSIVAGQTVEIGGMSALLEARTS